MFAEKPFQAASNSSSIHLPPVGRSHRRRLRPPPTPSYASMASKNAAIAENVSALKAKYTDYTTWLKASTRHQNREPVITQELLKNSLCQMGIDTGKAEQLVSTCTWYVYQFQKDLKIDPEQNMTVESKEQQSSRQYKNKPKKGTTIREHSGDSATTITSLNKDDSLVPNPLSSMRNQYSVLPAIHVSDLSASSRLRRVDFDNEESKNPIPDSLLSHGRSTLIKTRTLTKLKPISTVDNPPMDLDLSSSQQSFRRNGLVVSQTRSILRKQASLCSSGLSTDVSSRKARSRILTPSSTELDDIPLGTRSQRLFGGSECFAQIMNELEHQT